MPSGGRPDAIPIGIDIEKVWPPLSGCALGALDRALELPGFLDVLGFNPERYRGLGVVDIRIAEIARHVTAGLELAAAEVPDSIALIVVALVVEHDVHDRRLVARLRPQRLWTAEQETAVTNDRDH